MTGSFGKPDIVEMPLSSPYFRAKVERFLSANGIRFEDVNHYCVIQDQEGSILAGGGLKDDVIKCVAVSQAARSEGLSMPLVSHLVSTASTEGYTNLKVFTKPENEGIFTGLGFNLIARAPKAILMENGRGLEDYLATLSRSASCHPERLSVCHPEVCPEDVILKPALSAVLSWSKDLPKGAAKDLEGRSEGSSGVIIMNANPFTLGHQYLIRKASETVSRLFVIPVREDVSQFPYEERLEMIRKGSGDMAVVLEGSDYQISETTFPTYFLKDLSDASETQMRLDLDLFGRHIAPALGATVRFVGSEPADPLTDRYNALMKEILPAYGIRVIEIPRLTLPHTPRCHPEACPERCPELIEGPVEGRPSVCHPEACPERCPELVEGPVEGRPSVCHPEACPERCPELVEGPVEGRSEGSSPVTASAVRQALAEGHFWEAAALTPPTTWPYLVAELMSRAMRIELDAPCKPGLVDPSGNGAHTDMDYSLMKGSIDVIRRSFIRHLPMIQPSLEPCGSFESTVSDSHQHREETRDLEEIDYQDNKQRCITENDQTLSAKELNYSTLENTAIYSGLSAGNDPGLDADVCKRVNCAELQALLVPGLTAFGKAVEKDVLEYTGGVNTYRGAIFSLGLTAVAALKLCGAQMPSITSQKPEGQRICGGQVADNQSNGQSDPGKKGGVGMGNIFIDNDLGATAERLGGMISMLAAGIAAAEGSHGAKAVNEYGVKGALQMAREGYRPLFEDWLPYYQILRCAQQQTQILRCAQDDKQRGALRQVLRPAQDSAQGRLQDDSAVQKTLLRIMSQLDDTCVIHRVGYDRAQEVKKEAGALLGTLIKPENVASEEVSGRDGFLEGLEAMKEKYDREGISPGGAADMLALTVFIDSLLT